MGRCALLDSPIFSLRGNADSMAGGSQVMGNFARAPNFSSGMSLVLRVRLPCLPYLPGLPLLLLLGSLPGIACVSLHNQGLTEFPAPADLPATDTHVNLNNNQLTYIPEGALCHMTALQDLLIQNNLLQSVGNLSCVGETLKYLYITGNTPLTSIPDDAFLGLVKLERLYVYQNQLTAVPNLTPVASTLQTLGISNNPLAGDFAPAELAELSVLTSLQIHTIGLKGFPTLPASPELLNLQLGNEDLQIGAEDVLDLTPVPKLTSLVIHNGQFTRVPKIDASHLIATINLGYNSKIVFTGAGDFERFPQVTNLHMTHCGLTNIPDLTHLGESLQTLNVEQNPIQVISADRLNKLPRLTSISLRYTDVVSFPCAHLPVLNSLSLPDTPYATVPCIPPGLDSLGMDRSLLERIEVRHVVSLAKQKRIFVRSVPEFVEAHDYMDLSRTPTLSVTGSLNLDLCRCEHVWMKIAVERGATISATDKACGDNGEMWTALNSTQLLDICDASTLQAQAASAVASAASVWSVLRPDAASCHLPAHAYYASVPQVTCGRHCLALPGCTTYKFLGLKGRMGHCQVLVPTTPPAPVTVPDAGDAGWQCYTPLPGDTQKIIE